MRPPRIACFLVTAVLGLGCGEPPRPALAAVLPDANKTPLGCWLLVGQGWTSPFLPGSLLIRLDTSHVLQPYQDRALLILSADTAMRRHARRTAWAPYQAGDSIWANIGDGFSGLDFRLWYRGDSLGGRAYRYTDFEHFRSSGRITGSRRHCATAA